MQLPAPLRDALDAAVSGTPVGELAAAVSGLIERYRSPDALDQGQATAVLAGPVEVTAYAAYRMPATYAAVRAALTQVAHAVPTLEPASLLDLGGGTGAASWAATEVFPTIASVTVLDQVPSALALGRRLGAAHPVLRTARWERWRLANAPAEPLPVADLVTISYVLGELRAAQRAALVAAAARAGRAVLVIEPGTPAGYGRVLAARAGLAAAGLRVAAPCPHVAPCPLAEADWCHFAVRVNRSALHRRLKSATLSFEDEKFSYVAAAPSPAFEPAWSRVLRHPTQRKGMVRLRLCTPEAAATDAIVSRRAGDRYRAARDVSWGDAWPPG